MLSTACGTVIVRDLATEQQYGAFSYNSIAMSESTIGIPRNPHVDHLAARLRIRFHTAFGQSVGVRALNDVDEWRTSAHWRLLIEIEKG